MEWIIWILVIIVVVAIVVWMLRRNSGSTAGADAAAQRHPGNQPGSGANEPVMEAGPPTSNTPASGAAGSGAAGSAAGHGAAGDTNAVSADDERWRGGGSDITDHPTAADRGGEHTTAAVGPENGAQGQSGPENRNQAGADDGGQADADDGGHPRHPGQEAEHHALGSHNVGGPHSEQEHHSMGSHNQGEPHSEEGHHSLGSHNQGEPHSEEGNHSMGSHNIGDTNVEDEDFTGEDKPRGRHRNGGTDGEADDGKGAGR